MVVVVVVLVLVVLVVVEVSSREAPLRKGAVIVHLTAMCLELRRGTAQLPA